MFGGAYGNARMANWPHWHRTPLPRIATTGLRRDKIYEHERKYKSEYELEFKYK